MPNSPWSVSNWNNILPSEKHIYVSAESETCSRDVSVRFQVSFCKPAGPFCSFKKTMLQEQSRLQSSKYDERTWSLFQTDVNENSPLLSLMPGAGSAPKWLKILGKSPSTFTSVTIIDEQEMVTQAEGFVALPNG